MSLGYFRRPNLTRHLGARLPAAISSFNFQARFPFWEDVTDNLLCAYILETSRSARRAAFLGLQLFETSH